MAPKRAAGGKAPVAQDDVADLSAAPEHDDDRSLVIQCTGVLKARPNTAASETPRSDTGGTPMPFASILVQPTVTLALPSNLDTSVAMAVGAPAEGGPCKPEPLSTTEREFCLTLFTKRMTLNPVLVAQFLGGNFKVLVTSMPEAAAIAASTAAARPPGGAAAAAAAAKAPPAGKGTAAVEKSAAQGAQAQGKGGAQSKEPGTARSEGAEVEAVELLSLPFSLADILFNRNKTEFVFEGLNALHGFERFVVTVACNAPLLSPNNTLRYPAVIVSVNEVSHLPPLLPIEPHQHIQSITKSVNDSTEASRLRNTFEPVLVKAKWRAGVSVDFVTHRVSHCEEVKFNRTFVLFLHLLPKLRVLQSLYFDPLVFEIHDRDPKASEMGIDAVSPISGRAGNHGSHAAITSNDTPHGTVSVSLRRALDGEVRFIESTQVVAARTTAAASASVPADYYSYGTTLKTKIVFSTPLPFVTFVDMPPVRPTTSHSTEGGLGAGADSADSGIITVADTTGTLGLEPCVAFLSRVAVIMPYSSEVTGHMIGAIMGVIMEQSRASASSDVVEVVRKAAGPTAAELAAVAAPVKGSKGGKGAAEAAPVEEPPPPPPTVYHPAGGMRQQVLAAVPDSVSGFEIMDGDKRIIVVEGQLPFVSRLAAIAASVAGNDPDVKILFNFELPLLRRAYHVWPPLVLPIIVNDGANAAGTTDNVTDDVLNQTHSGSGGGGKAGASGKGGAAGTAGKGTAGTVPKPPAGGKGGAGPKVPPLASSAATAGAADSQAPSPTAAATTSDAGELDAGGVGGRIRRIRLKSTLEQTYHTKSYYLKRSLNHDALTCVHRLMQLTAAPSMIHSLDHDCFPTAQEIIALERIAGDCLDTYDVCAAAKFYNFAERNIDDVVAAAVQMQMDAMAEKPAEHQIDLSDLSDPASLGRVVSFVAVPTPADEARQLPSLSTAVRYHEKAYMTDYASRKPVRCAFSGPPPTQLLRFMVTGQVVPDGSGSGILFVMSCASLAKKGTDSRNPTFVAKKKADEKLLPASMYFKLKRDETERYRVTHKAPHPRNRPYQDDSSDDDAGFVDEAPYSPKHDLLSGQHEEAPQAATHFIGLHRRKLAALSADSGAARAQEREETIAKYSNAISTHNSLVRREHETMQKLASLRPHDDRPDFSTMNIRTALEDARPKLAPSASRVDDLKQKWVPPAPSLFQQQGPPAKPMKFEGGKNCTSQNFESVFAENASDKLQREAEERRRAQEEWSRGVVVEDVKFRVACKQPGPHPHAIDKHRTLLQDEAKKHSLKLVKLDPAPVSIRAVEKEPPKPRVERTVVKHPEAKAFYYAKDVLDKLPKIPGMSPGEKRGPLWGASSYEAPRFAD